jgi:hypothetical protein
MDNFKFNHSSRTRMLLSIQFDIASMSISKVIWIAAIVIASVGMHVPQKAVAQNNVGVNIASPAPSALLDLTSTTQGFLVPRVTTTQRNAITTANGLLVFDNSLNLFYYFNGTIWTPFLSNSNGWLLTGNGSTIPGTNFVGTTDLQDLVFKTNSSEGYRLTSTGLLGIGITAPTQKLEVQGNVKIDNLSGAASNFQFSNPAGTFTSNIQAGAQSASIAYTLPLLQGSANSWLSNDGSGALSWILPSSLNWSLLGNSGTVSATNFEGTIDNVDMVWKSNNTEGMRLSAAGNLGIGTISPTSVLHTVASGTKTANFTGNLLTNTTTSSTASVTKYGAEVLSTAAWNGLTAKNIGLHANATGGSTNYSAILEGGKVGVNTTTPNTYVDISGDLATRYSAITASNGANNDVAIGASSLVRFTGPTAAFSITGLAGGVDGKMVTLINSTSQQITISDESASSVVANRIWTLDNTGDLVVNGKGMIDLIYSAADSRWLVITASTTVSTSTTGTITKKKTIDQSLTTTTLTNDNDLVIPIPANDSMQFEGYFDQKSASGGQDGVVGFVIPTGAKMNAFVFATKVGSITQYFLKTSNTASGKIDYNTNAADENGILVFGTVVTGSTAGSIQVVWASSGSTSTPLHYSPGSYLEATYIRK